MILAAQASWWIASTVPARFNLLATEVGVTVGATLVALGVFVWLLIGRQLTGVRAVAWRPCSSSPGPRVPARP